MAEERDGVFLLERKVRSKVRVSDNGRGVGVGSCGRWGFARRGWRGMVSVVVVAG